jgi:homocitrate synthase NifV
MIRLIDNTLTSLDQILPSKEDLLMFCKLLFIIGVDAIELSVSAYKRMEYLPENCKFILNINQVDEMESYPGFYRYVCHHEGYVDRLIHEIQLNDAREIVRLRALRHCEELRIVGLDDLMCNYSYDKIMKEMKNCLPNGTIILCPENTYGCASALALQWILEFGTDITTSFAGCKNNAATEEVIMAMRLAIRHKPNRNLTVLPELTKLYEKFKNKPVGNKKPIIGKNIFKVEAGIHADGIKKNPATYEAYDPSWVGGKSELVIGKHSGTKAIKIKMEELGIHFPEDLVINKILLIVKMVCTQERKSLTDDDFKKLVSEVTADERDQIYR